MSSDAGYSSASSSYSGWERVGEVATQMLVDLARDKGRLLMNVGAVTSLAGFMMSDVLQLRMLNVTGTLCGMAYNCTRKPAQWNAVAWGVVFGGVNVAMICKLLQERTIAVTFTIDEMDLYHMHFEETEVTPQQFKQLIDKGTWQDARRGEVIVRNGRPLGSVILFHKGHADAVGSDGTILYTYGGGRSTGCIVGGTALVDSEVRTKAYPNKVVAVEGVRYIFWDTNLLLQLMKDDKAMHSAIMQLLYGTLINTLRADRLAEKQRQKEIKQESSEQIIKQYTLLLKGVMADEKVGTKEKECVLEFAKEHNITNTQHLHLLQKLGWSEHEWGHGKKQNKDEDGGQSLSIAGKGPKSNETSTALTHNNSVDGVECGT